MDGPTVPPLSPGSEPARHYNAVVDAWGALLEEDLHYGYFVDAETSLVEATNELTNQMLALAEPRAGHRVLDVGCGTGKAACRIATEWRASVVGISPSTVCVDRATALAERSGVRHLATFVVGDGTAMSFGDRSFDRVWVMESSHLMRDKPALIAECARVLRPGGRMVLCDIMIRRKLAIEDVIRHRDEFLLLRDVFGRAIMEPLSFYQSSLESLGLRVTTARDISGETYPTFEHWRRNANQNREHVCGLIGEHAWTQFLSSCDVLERFWDRSILCYGILCAEKIE